MSLNTGAGELSERWNLQQKTQVRNTSGGVDVTWTTLRKVWCKITPTSPSMRLEAGSREPQITHTVIARLEGGDIDPTKRLTKGSRALMISGNVAIIDEADNLVQFGCIEGVAT